MKISKLIFAALGLVRFFYSVISELGDASNINRSQIATTWRQNEV